MTKPVTRKPAATAKAPAKTAIPAVEPVVRQPQDAADSEADTPELRKKALVELVAEKADVKKKVARDVVEVVLAEIGAALSRGESLNLPPLGKAKINRQKEQGNAEVIVLRLRRGGKSSGDTAETDLAEPND